jgi:thymidylate synthase ThyX
MGKKIKELVHIKKNTEEGEVVYVLDNGATIDSEGEAMLQALHSRSVGGFEHHLRILEEKGAANFMKNFYVGYGHKSIGDCGSTTIFIENISMLAAKAIQDSKLYSGQEASTRYIDFSKQKFINPTKSEQGNEILEDLRNFYLLALEKTIENLKELHPKLENEKESIYEKAIKARAFDICRGFLPAGASTNLAWHSNLRQISDRILFLRHHPLSEIRRIAKLIEDAVIEKHPNSFSIDRYEDTENYQDIIAKKYLYYEELNDDIEIENNVDVTELNKFKEIIDKRPIKTELPKYLSHLGTIKAKFKLDFGSYRDLQRHRAIYQKMPLLTTKLGFNNWYIENLPENLKKETKDFLIHIEKKIEKLTCSDKELQYYIPMGYNISNYIHGDLPSMIYMIELRATRFVHPTLRKIAINLGKYIEKTLKIPIHFDKEADRFDIKRGEHDIVIK